MTSLETKLNAILNDKLTNLKPENLKKGITCLGVTGTLEASASSGGIKQFSTVEEMNSSTGNTEGDLAVVYSSVLRNIQNGDIITTIIWPETVTFDTAITRRHTDRIESGDYVLSLMLSDTEAYIEYMSNDGSLSYDANYSSEDGLTYTNMDGEEVYTIPAMTISNANEYTCKFVKSNILSFGGLYKYSGTAWELAPTDLTTAADDVYLTKFYGKNGIETGTLQSKENLTKDEVRRRAGIWSNYNSGLVCPNDASNMFDSYTDLTAIPLLDTSNVTNMYQMFSGCTNLTTIPLLDTSNVTNMQYMFNGCTSLTTMPLLDTSNVTNMTDMFNGCTNLTTIPELNTSSVTSMYNMFSSCTNLTTIPLLNTSNVTTMRYMFYRCTSLTTIPELNTSSVTNMSYMFQDCTSLTEIPLLNTSKVTSMFDTFSNCRNLTTIPELNTSNVTNMSNMFRDCTSLSDESLNNILAMCANATAYTKTKTLKYIGLTSEQATKCTTLSNYQAFLDAGWTTGY